MENIIPQLQLQEVAAAQALRMKVLDNGAVQSSLDSGGYHQKPLLLTGNNLPHDGRPEWAESARDGKLP